MRCDDLGVVLNRDRSPVRHGAHCCVEVWVVDKDVVGAIVHGRIDGNGRCDGLRVIGNRNVVRLHRRIDECRKIKVVVVVRHLVWFCDGTRASLLL